MDEPEYEEAFEYEQQSKLPWILFALAAIVAIVFAVLWYLRGGEVTRQTAELASAQTLAQSTEERLQQEADDVRATADEARRTAEARITELETLLRDEQRKTADATAELERNAQNIDAAQSEALQTAQAGQEALREQLAASWSRATNLAQQLSAAKESLRAAELARAEAESQHATARKELADAVAAATTAATGTTGAAADATDATAEAKAAEAMNRLAQMEKRAADAENAAKAATARATESEKTLADLRKHVEQSTKLETRLVEAGTSLATLEKKIAELETSNAALTKNLAAATKNAATATYNARQAAAARDDLLKTVEEAKNQAKNAAETLANREKELLGSLEKQQTELQKQKAELQNQLDAAKAEAAKNADAAQSAIAEARAAVAAAAAAPSPTPPAAPAAQTPDAAPATPPAPVPAIEAAPAPAAPAAAAPAPASQEWSYVEDETGSVAAKKSAPPVVAKTAKPPKHVIIRDPSRAVGQVVQALGDGLTFVVKHGANQRVKPGMVFDVHRRSGRMSRYIGLLLVTRVLDDFSLAIPASPTFEARICPVTGRVVLDPARTSSPYAEVEGGKPVPLISASSLGLGREMPEIGDCIDNPYYDPNGSLAFFVGPDMKNETRIPALVEGVGGVLTGTRDEADFEIVRTLDPRADPVALPQETTLDAFGVYYVEPPAPAPAAAPAKK